MHVYTYIHVCIYKTCLSPKVKLSSLSDPTDPTSPSTHKSGTSGGRYIRYIKNSITKPPVPCPPKKTDFSLSFYSTLHIHIGG